MIITTAPRPSERINEQVRKLAAELSAKAIPRRNASIQKLLDMSDDNRVIIATEKEVRFYDNANEPPLYFHPSMAYVRVKRLRRGETDPLIELSGCSIGDHIIDCTAGMAADSLVFSYAVGEQGRVEALESEPILCALVREGLASYESGLPDVDAAMKRIHLSCKNHAHYLANLPNKSADIVYFDPMFRQPIMESSAISAFRTIANMDALSAEVVEHAVRVARKTVVIKENQRSGEFERLGFKRTHANTSKIAYGVIHVGSA
ncbi:class I SAM-dependent methyltransferase [Paenibacillus sp. L3-i20]|uniref:class I SAM-dependent methyltransferase n=1 Tax=Paenibacillus sp. L3-i20 TaxID=2905833 RepID=UPI001EDCEFD1|nr:class I SAM-dependent methyltransferase [Paenibacillus sp. L3-i20]GKU79365.1 hypothetical protein L3i20_v237620 [Paenibacillus sp. L3-i20]